MFVLPDLSGVAAGGVVVPPDLAGAEVAWVVKVC